VRLRRWLRLHDPLGYVGAAAIRRNLLAAGEPAPSARTIARILHRAGVTPQKRRRHPPPPAGWYLPAVAAGRAELDQLDVVEGLPLRRGGPVEVLTGISLWGKLAWAEPAHAGWRVESIRAVLAAHWQRWGAPEYLQMDNDTRFAGSSRAVRRLGRLIRFCLAHGVVPVFAPPRETGFQAAVESFNALWQAKVWQRFRHRDLRQLRSRNQAFLEAHHRHHVQDLVPRRTGPRTIAELVVLLRRTDAACSAPRSSSRRTGRTGSCAPNSTCARKPCASTRCAAAHRPINPCSKSTASRCAPRSLFSLGGVRGLLSLAL